MEAVLRERYLVKPTKPHSLSSFSHSLSLSPLDLKCIALPYTQRILFYPPPLSSSSSSFLQIASHIRESLADALVLFCPFAGRLVRPASGEIECSDAGAEFVVAYVDQRMPEISELWKMDLPPDWLNIVAMPLHALDAADQPLLRIQVTEFQCGGFCIGCSFSHVVADGYSFWHFMKSWSEIARGGPISLTPLHNRELLKLTNSSNQAAEGENTSQGGVGGQASWVPYKNTVFHLSKEAIARLKQEVNEEGGVTHNGSHFSSFESLCAFFWRAITRARLIPDDEETKFCTAVNCRRRLEPPLSDAYFGNAITNVYASAKAGDLARRELSYAARLVHKAISKCDKISISEMQIMPSSIWPPSANDLFVGGSPRFPLYEIDFGWGKPVVVRRPQFFSQGVMIVDPGFQGEGSVSVSIGLSSEALEILMRNEEIIQICRDPMSLT